MDKKSKNTLIVSIIALVLVLIGVTYAYFSARITGLESASTIRLTAGRMGIVYSEGNEEVTFSNIYPKEEVWVTKTFTLTGYNTTAMAMDYDIGLNVTTNTFEDEYLTYDLILVSGSNGTPVATKYNQPISGTGNIKFGTGTFQQANGDTHNYQLKIYFKDNGEDQNDAQQAVFNAKIYVGEYNPNRTVALSRPVYSINQQDCEDYFDGDPIMTASEITSLCSGELTYMEDIGRYIQLGVGLGIDEELIGEGIIYANEAVFLSTIPATGDRYQEGQFVYKYNGNIDYRPRGFLSQPVEINSRMLYYNGVLLDNEYDFNLDYEWILNNSEGWGVSVADRNSTAPITEKLLKSINGKAITNMSYMFAASQATSINLSSFDTSNVTDMSYMFSGSQATSLDLSSFDTSNVTNMGGMFTGISATTLDLSSFDLSSVTNMEDMFDGSQVSTIYARSLADAEILCEYIYNNPTHIYYNNNHMVCEGTR